MPRAPHIAVVGSIVMDLVVTTPRVPLVGENLLAHGFTQGPGGKGANSSVALARLGARSRLVGMVGDDDFGRGELAAVRAEGVQTESVGIDPERGTGAAVIMVDDQGENTILVSIGANEGLSPEAVGVALAPHWDELDAILVNFEIPEPAVRAVVGAGADHGVPVVVDAGPPRQHGPATWRRCTVISPNMIEMESLVGRPVQGDAEAVAAARELLAQGPEAVVLKMGARGALVVTADVEEHVPAFEVDVVDTTGAGDAFTAALTMGVALRERDLVSVVRTACAAGGLAVTKLGTMVAMPTREQVEAFLAGQDLAYGVRSSSER